MLEAMDPASGLNPRRRGVRRGIQAAETHRIQAVVMESPDRLARVGYEYLRDGFRVLGVTVVVTSAHEPDDASTEWVKDLLAIVTSFSARLDGARGGRHVRDTVAQAIAEVQEHGELPSAGGQPRLVYGARDLAAGESGRGAPGEAGLLGVCALGG